MSVNAIIEKLPEQSKKASNRGASLRFTAIISGVSIIDQRILERRVVQADLVYDLASVSKVVESLPSVPSLYAKGELVLIAL